MITTAVILAAGQGTRMRSALPKVLHPVLGKPMIWHAIHSVRAVTSDNPVLVVGHESEAVIQFVGDQAHFAIQVEQLGTGHAVQQAEELLKGNADQILVTMGDMPLLREQTMQKIIDMQTGHSGPITLATISLDDPHGFGRIVRDATGNVLAIVEEADATEEQRAIHELNAGVYCFDADWLWDALKRIPLSQKGEYYLTDLVEIANADGLSVQAYSSEDPAEMIGINTRVHLAEATSILRQRINREWMLAGVSMVDPETTYIEPGVQIGADTMIYQNTTFQGETQIGERCEIGPNSVIVNTQVGDDCRIFASVLEDAVIENRVDIGPFGHLRKGAHLAEDVHMGNFGEVKASYLGKGSKMGHFSYIGNADIGEDVNIGAGTITCNYDGVHKHKTEIGKGSFIGSDTMLVAPLRIGERSRTGAGAVVTKDVADDALVVGVPARELKRNKKDNQEDT